MGATTETMPTTLAPVSIRTPQPPAWRRYGDAGMRPDQCSAMMHLGVMAHYANGSCYPVGGSGAIPRKLNATVIAGGGRSFVQARVEGLLLDGSGSACGVRLTPTVKGGAPLEVRAKVVISGTGALRSYRDFLLPLKPQLGPPAASMSSAAVRRIEEATTLSVAFIFLFIGLDIPEDAPDDVRTDTRSHNTWIYPKQHYTEMEQEIEAAPPWTLPMPMFVASGSAKDAQWEVKHGRRKRTVVVLSQVRHCPACHALRRSVFMPGP